MTSKELRNASIIERMKLKLATMKFLNVCEEANVALTTIENELDIKKLDKKKLDKKAAIKPSATTKRAD